MSFLIPSLLLLVLIVGPSLLLWLITHDLNLSFADYLRPFFEPFQSSLDKLKQPTAEKEEPVNPPLDLFDEEVFNAHIRCAYDKGFNEAKTKFEAMLKDHESNGYRMTAFSACGKCHKLCSFCVETPADPEAEQIMDREMAARFNKGTRTKKPIMRRN